MNMELVRKHQSGICTIGELSIEGKFQCYILEDVVREVPGMPVEQWKIAGKTAIPTGDYEVIITLSNRFKRDLPLLKDVPGFAGIRIHPGNTAEDTEGCLLPGTHRSADSTSVLHSRVAFDDLFMIISMNLLVGKIFLTVK